MLASLAPVIAAAPPVLIGLAIGAGLLWLLSGSQEKPQPAPDVPAPTPGPKAAPAVESAPPPLPARRVRREDVAEALVYGARSMTRGEAVAALQALGFGKTAAYKALSPDGRFAEFLAQTPDGLLEWKG